MRSALFSLSAAVFLTASTLAAAREEAGDRSQSTVSGCLQSTPEPDIYILKTKAADLEVRGTSDLKDHLGQQVSVTGSWMEGRSDASGKENASTEERDRHLSATAVRQIAATCESR